MNLQNYCVLFALALTVSLVAVTIYCIAKKSNLFVVTLFGKTYTFGNPLREDSYALSAPAPHIPPINDFLKDFVDSTEKRIEFTPDDIKPNSNTHPLLRALQGMDYERVRLRLRIISSLNPTLNLKTEDGIIQFTCGLASGVPQQVKLRSQFAPKGQSILLEKL